MTITVNVRNKITGATKALQIQSPIVTSSGGGARFPGDAGPGFIKWGQTREGGIANVPARAQQYGQALGRGPVFPSAVRRYMTPAQSNVAGARAAVADCRTIQSWGALPFMDVKEPASMSFAQVAAGQMDDVIDAIMEGLVQLAKPAMVGFHQEPVGDGKGTYTECGDALKRWAQRRDAAGAAGLVSVTCCIGQGSFPPPYGHGGNPDPDKWIAAVEPWSDVIGGHGYLQATDASAPSAWRTAHDVYGPWWDLQDKTIGTGKARVQGEWGVHTRASDLTFAPKFMQEFYDYGLSRRMAVACFFDSGQNSANDWTLDLPVNGKPDTTRLVQMAHQLVLPTTR